MKNILISLIILSVGLGCRTQKSIINFPKGTHLLMVGDNGGLLYGRFNKKGVMKSMCYIGAQGDTIVQINTH